MKKKNGFLSRIGDFVAGRGFYIVLLLCALIIGATAWIYVKTVNGDSVDVGALGAGSNVSDSGQSGQGSASSGGTQDSNQGGSNAGGTSSRPAGTGRPDACGTQHEYGPGQEQGSGSGQQTDQSYGKNDGAVSAGLTLSDIVFSWPLDGQIITTYAMDRLLYDKTMLDWRVHNGLDMACDLGTKVMAVADGTVKEVYTDPMLGTTVSIDHGAGVVTYYSNLASVPTVEAGDWVWLGYVIGSVGDTAGGESGIVPHLHVSMTIDGEAVDPEDYFPN